MNKYTRYGIITVTAVIIIGTAIGVTANKKEKVNNGSKFEIFIDAGNKIENETTEEITERATTINYIYGDDVQSKEVQTSISDDGEIIIEEIGGSPEDETEVALANKTPNSDIDTLLILNDTEEMLRVSKLAIPTYILAHTEWDFNTIMENMKYPTSGIVQYYINSCILDNAAELESSEFWDTFDLYFFTGTLNSIGGLYDLKYSSMVDANRKYELREVAAFYRDVEEKGFIKLTDSYVEYNEDEDKGTFVAVYQYGDWKVCTTYVDVKNGYISLLTCVTNLPE